MNFQFIRNSCQELIEVLDGNRSDKAKIVAVKCFVISIIRQVIGM